MAPCALHILCKSTDRLMSKVIRSMYVYNLKKTNEDK